MSRRFQDPDGVVHIVTEAWDIVGERVPVEFSLRKAVDAPRSVLPLNLRFTCRERGLWMQDPSNGTPTKEVVTCLFCLSRGLPGT